MNVDTRDTPTPPLHTTVGTDEIFRFPDGIWITCHAPLLRPRGPGLDRYPPASGT